MLQLLSFDLCKLTHTHTHTSFTEGNCLLNSNEKNDPTSILET